VSRVLRPARHIIGHFGDRSVLTSNKGYKYGTFWSFSGGHTVCIHDFAMKYMTADWAVAERMLKLLI